MVNSFHLYYTYYNIMHTLLKARNKQRKSLNILKGINCKELMNLFFSVSLSPIALSTQVSRPLSLNRSGEKLTQWVQIARPWHYQEGGSRGDSQPLG